MWSDTSFWFWFAFPWWLMMLNTFSYICMSSLEKYQIFFPFFNQNFFLLSWMNSLSILDKSFLSDMWFANVFPHSTICLFIFLFFFGGLLCCIESFNFDVVTLVYFCFCCLCFWCQVQKIIATTGGQEIISYVFL